MRREGQKRRVVCYDESANQLNGEERRAEPAPSPGRDERYDCE